MTPLLDDEHWMDIAIQQAERGVGKTAPNPPVGAVVVRNGKMLGQGWHRAAGQPHAEREAIANAVANYGPESLRDSTLYVTLEPCSTHGRTPPCTKGIIEAGFARVVYACRDENPAHSGRADADLRDAGIEVTSGVLQVRASCQLDPFFKVRRTGLPWVIWKTAMTLDGRLTRLSSESKWLTSEASRLDVQGLRARVDAVFTSGETVRRDHPMLNIRVPSLLEGRSQPLRVVFSGKPESLPQDAPLFNQPGRTIVRPCEALAASLEGLVKSDGILSAMLEAGGVLSSAFLAAGLIDEIVVYLAPLLAGGPIPTLNDPICVPPLKLSSVTFERIIGSHDLRLRARVKSQ